MGLLEVFKKNLFFPPLMFYWSSLIFSPQFPTQLEIPSSLLWISPLFLLADLMLNSCPFYLKVLRIISTSEIFPWANKQMFLKSYTWGSICWLENITDSKMFFLIWKEKSEYIMEQPPSPCWLPSETQSK